jgi:hypothetical protein
MAWVSLYWDTFRDMKACLNRKITSAAAGLLAVALWCAYSLGYHHGGRNERRLWESTLQLTQRPDHSGGAARLQTLEIYANPHHGLFAGSSPVARVNTPDPRAYP